MISARPRLTGIGLLAGVVLHGGLGLAGMRAVGANAASAPAASGRAVSYSAAAHLASNLSLTSSGILPGGVEQDMQHLAAVFRAYGYFGAEIKEWPQLPQARFGPLPGSAIRPIEWRAVAGPLYKIGLVELRGIGGLRLTPEAPNDFAQLLARYPGLPARAAIFDSMEDEIRWRLLRASYPFAVVAMRSIVPDQTSRTVTVRMNLDVGVQARFGEVSFKGLVRVKKERLMEKITFSTGDLFDPLKLQGFEQNLGKMSLFEDVKVRYAEKADAAGLLPIQVRVREHGIAKEKLESSTLKGMITTLLALGLLSMNQVALAGGAPLKFTRPVAVTCLMLLAACGVFALQRAASLLSAL